MNTSASLPEQGQFSVSGLVVHASPAQQPVVKHRLNTMPGVEIHGCNNDGRLVVTVEEQPGQKLMVDTITRISQVEGVISTALVYTHTDAWSEV